MPRRIAAGPLPGGRGSELSRARQQTGLSGSSIRCPYLRNAVLSSRSCGVSFKSLINDFFERTFVRKIKHTIMAAKTALSLEQFLCLPDFEEDGTHYELDEGELIKLSPTGTPHGVLVIRIGAYLQSILDPKHFTVVGGEVGFILNENPERPIVRGADVAVINTPSDGRFAEGMSREPAVVVVEIVSPSNEAEYIERKTKQYLRSAVKEVWVVYPKAETVYVYRADAQPSVAQYRRGDRFPCCFDLAIDTERFFSL
jgi:Uma2 family endonuclease